jgi:hypothetical protein
MRLLGDNPTIQDEKLWDKFQKVQLAKAFVEGKKEKE